MEKVPRGAAYDVLGWVYRQYMAHYQALYDLREVSSLSLAEQVRRRWEQAKRPSLRKASVFDLWVAIKERAEAETMRVLWSIKACGVSAPVRTLGEVLGLSPATVSRAIGRLERAGLLVSDEYENSETKPQWERPATQEEIEHCVSEELYRILADTSPKAEVLTANTKKSLRLLYAGALAASTMNTP